MTTPEAAQTPEPAQTPRIPPLAPPLVMPEPVVTEALSPPRHGWWRRNALALGVVAVLLPATVATIGLHEWWGYFSGRAVFAVDPGGDGLVEHAGATWGPVIASEATSTEGLNVPPNARVLIAKIPVEPHGDPARCAAPELVEQSTGRRWSEMRHELGLPWNSDEPTTCVFDATAPYNIFVPFIVPEDAAGPYWIEIDTFTAPDFVRFPINPQ